MQFHACSENDVSSFLVPCNTVDLHINNASGAYFKVLLVLLRNEQENFTSEDISSQTSLPIDDVNEAVRYWINCKVLPEKTVVGVENTDKKIKTSQSVMLGSKEVAKLVRDNRGISFLFESAESLFGRPVTGTEQKVIVSMHEWMGLPVDVILMIIEYCLLVDKKTIRYIEKMAAGWADEGIVTHELAETKIKHLKDRNTYMGQIMTAFGIGGRTLSINEKKHISKWKEEYNFPIDMIKHAYEITLDNTGKVAFAYINKILTNWHEKGYKVLADTKQEQRPKSVKNRIKCENDSFDVNSFEEMGLYDIPDVKDGD